VSQSYANKLLITEKNYQNQFSLITSNIWKEKSMLPLWEFYSMFSEILEGKTFISHEDGAFYRTAMWPMSMFLGYMALH
jgi:hypothetical protein